VDPRTRLAAWVVELTPKEGATEDLRPGAAVVVTVRAGKPHRVTAVPKSAIVEISTRPYVFVQSEGESFLKRLVTLGISDGRYVEIKSGLDPRERVVTEGGFDVHVASLSGTVESHRH
jgi:cobalt-zinc-cadmium efflux system membrane fusion protein